MRKLIMMAAMIASQGLHAAESIKVEAQGDALIRDGKILVEPIDGNRICLDLNAPIRSCVVFRDGIVWADTVIADTYTIETGGFELRIFDANDKYDAPGLKGLKATREPGPERGGGGREPRERPNIDKPGRDKPGPVIGVGDVNVDIDVDINIGNGNSGGGGGTNCGECHDPNIHRRP